MALYPGSSPRRALFVDPAIPLAPARDLGTATDIASALTAVSSHLAAAPWRDRFPATLGDVSIAAGQDPIVVDAAGDALPTAPGTDLAALLALTGGAPCSVFGEIEAGRFRILSLVIDGEVTAL